MLLARFPGVLNIVNSEHSSQLNHDQHVHHVYQRQAIQHTPHRSIVNISNICKIIISTSKLKYPDSIDAVSTNIPGHGCTLNVPASKQIVGGECALA